MRIEWSRRARNDLRDLKNYIAKDSPFCARQFIERIIRTVETLTERPKIGRMVPEADREDVRKIIYQGYRILIPD
jgi:plasmid stabilization system protein ParE